MAKYLTEFNTYAEYQAATLSLPNVSLIKSTGKVYYKNIFAGATLGDILMWDNVNNKLVTTISGNWSTELFPIAQYEPIAINVYPADQASDGKSRFMALRWASNASATGNANKVNLYWAPSEYKSSVNETALDGRSNTNDAIAVMPNTSGNTQAEYPIFYAVNQFYTNGTSAGDWYVPSKGELSLYQSNYSDINTKIEAIKTASSSIVSTVSGYQWSSTAVDNSVYAWLINNSGQYYSDGKYNKNGVRGMIAL